MGNPKMCNILKTADRRAKWMKIWHLGTTVYICRVLLMPESLSLVWVHSVQFVKLPSLRFSKRYSFNGFYQILTNIQSISITG